MSGSQDESSWPWARIARKSPLRRLHLRVVFAEVLHGIVTAHTQPRTRNFFVVSPLQETTIILAWSPAQSSVPQLSAFHLSLSSYLGAGHIFLLSWLPPVFAPSVVKKIEIITVKI